MKIEDFGYSSKFIANIDFKKILITLNYRSLMYLYCINIHQGSYLYCTNSLLVLFVLCFAKINKDVTNCCAL